MIMQVSKSMFQEGMQKQGMGYGAAEVLFDYIEQLEDEMGEQIDFDPISIVSEFEVAEGDDELKDVLEDKGYLEYDEEDEADLDDAKQRAMDDGVIVYEDSDYYVIRKM